MAPWAWTVAAVLVVVAFSWWRFDPVRADRRLPWRQLLVGGWQVVCWARGHPGPWREVDNLPSLPGFRNPYLWVCSRCGAAAVREGA